MAYLFLDDSQNSRLLRISVTIVDELVEAGLQPPGYVRPQSAVVQQVSHSSELENEAEHQNNSIL